MLNAGGAANQVIYDAFVAGDLAGLQIFLEAWILEGRPSLEHCLYAILNHPHSINIKDFYPFIKALADAGVSLETRIGHGTTPLLMCPRVTNLFDAFLKAGADRNTTDCDGRGVLHCFVFYDDYPEGGRTTQRSRKRFEMGFDPLITDNGGNNLLHLALPRSHQYIPISESHGPDSIAFLRALAECGLSARARNSNGMTPLHCWFLSADHPNTPRPEYLDQLSLEQTGDGIDINAQDAHGATALQLLVPTASLH